MNITENCEFMEDEIYPLTIVRDRFSGVYSGGEYTAWNLEFNEIPIDISLCDSICMDFWDNDDKLNHYVIGKGRTSSEALADLYIKLKCVTN